MLPTTSKLPIQRNVASTVLNLQTALKIFFTVKQVLWVVFQNCAVKKIPKILILRTRTFLFAFRSSMLRDTDSSANLDNAVTHIASHIAFEQELRIVIATSDTAHKPNLHKWLENCSTLPSGDKSTLRHPPKWSCCRMKSVLRHRRPIFSWQRVAARRCQGRQATGIPSLSSRKIVKLKLADHKYQGCVVTLTALSGYFWLMRTEGTAHRIVILR